MLRTYKAFMRQTQRVDLLYKPDIKKLLLVVCKIFKTQQKRHARRKRFKFKQNVIY